MSGFSYKAFKSVENVAGVQYSKTINQLIVHFRGKVLSSSFIDSSLIKEKTLLRYNKDLYVSAEYRPILCIDKWKFLIMH